MLIGEGLVVIVIRIIGFISRLTKVCWGVIRTEEVTLKLCWGATLIGGRVGPIGLRLRVWIRRR